MSRPRSTEASLFRHCPYCAVPLVVERRDGRPRPTCPACGYIQYRNPVVGVAAILTEIEIVGLLGIDAVRAATGQAPDPRGSRLLLGRRSVSPKGKFCLPCGYVEFDEDHREALVREVAEETGLIVVVEDLFAAHSNFHDPDRQSVGLWYRARPVGGALRPGDDVDALILARPENPGVALAFPTDGIVLARLAEMEADPCRAAGPRSGEP
ncbi:MAG: NUDIX domain-containing protein [Candidatus Eisenbacteria bacterium]|nr:NUDIX domain-containing protein [Candidatus Eisenbacteria bacterium]